MLTAVYDLATSPPTFDCIGFLLSAERERTRRGWERIRVVIVPGPDNGFRRDHLPPRDPQARCRMLQNIVVPMMKLLPSADGCAVMMRQPTQADLPKADFPHGWTWRSRVPHYGTHHIVEAVKAGCMPLTTDNQTFTPEGAIKKQVLDRNPHLVTITLRESHYWPTRNSNAESWYEAARAIRSQGFEVVFVPDELTEKRPGFEYDDGAAENVILRAELYERARLNLFVNGGPATLALAMRDVKALRFKNVAAGAPCVSADSWKSFGIPPGSQISENHRFVWEDDTTEAIVRETIAELEKEIAYG